MVMKFVGHRGNGRTVDNPFAGDRAPQNTLLSFEQAIDSGVDGLEFDVFLSRDNVPVILDREEFEGQTLSQLFQREIRRFMLPQNQFVPTLAETLDLIGKKTLAMPEKKLILNVELKGPSVVEPTLNVIRKTLAQHPHLSSDQIHYCSVDRDKLSLVREYEPDANIQPMVRTSQFFDLSRIQMPGYHVDANEGYVSKEIDDLRSYIVDKNCNGIDVCMLDIRPELIDMASKLGVGISTYPSGPRRLKAAEDMHRVITMLDDFSRSGGQVMLKGDDVPFMRQIVQDCREAHTRDVEKMERFMGMRFLTNS